LSALDHAAVADKGHPFTTEAFAGFVDLRRKGLGILGVAAKDFHRNGFSSLVAQSADDDLFFVLLAIPAVAIGSQGVVLPLQVATGDIVEKQLRFFLSSPSK